MFSIDYKLSIKKKIDYLYKSTLLKVRNFSNYIYIYKEEEARYVYLREYHLHNNHASNIREKDFM